MKTVYTSAFKAQEEKSLSQLAGEYKIHPNVLREWRTAAVSNLASLFERGAALLLIPPGSLLRATTPLPLAIFAVGQISLAAHAWGWMRGRRTA